MMEESDNEQDALIGSQSHEENHSREPDNEPNECVGCRHVLALLAFLGFVNVYALRVNLSVALVSMVTQTHGNKTELDDSCPLPGNSTKEEQPGEFDWDSATSGLVLSAFFYGYLFTQIPGGWLAERYGGSRLFGGGVACTSVLTLLTPIAARWSVPCLIVVRVLEGFGEGVTFPAMHAILAQWAPPKEKTKLAMFIYAGAQFGTVVSLPISGLLCSSAPGWPSVFYVFGALGCVWCIVWFCLIYDHPAMHPRISAAELNYIQRSIGTTLNAQRMPTPWLALLTSLPFYSLIFAHMCNNWGFYTLLTCLPKYLSEVLHFDISNNGLLSALPYLLMWIVINLGGQTADYIRARHYMSTTAVRKLYNTAGFMLPCIFLITIGYIGCNRAWAVTFVTLAVGLSGLGTSGYNVNHLDLAPNHAGTMMGITNTFATIPGIVAPELVGFMTNHDHSRAQWQNIFYISASIYAFGAFVFLAFGSGTLQKWAHPEYAFGRLPTDISRSAAGPTVEADSSRIPESLLNEHRALQNSGGSINDDSHD